MEKISQGQLYAIIPTLFLPFYSPYISVHIVTCIWTLDIVQVMYSLASRQHLAPRVFDHFQYLDETIDDVHTLNLFIM